MKTTTPEGIVLRDCLKVLRQAKWSHWRANTGAARLPGKGGKLRPVFFGPKGQPDIYAIVNRSGRLLACECKAGKNKPTEDQRAFLAAVEAAGGVALVAYSALDLIATVERLTRDPFDGLDGLDDDPRPEPAHADD